MPDTWISASDATQLTNFWWGRSVLPRPVRRRLEAAEMIAYSYISGTWVLTAKGYSFMVEHAPRSPWSPPKNAADGLIQSATPTQRRTMPAYQMALVAAILGGGGR